MRQPRRQDATQADLYLGCWRTEAPWIAFLCKANATWQVALLYPSPTLSPLHTVGL